MLKKDKYCYRIVLPKGTKEQAPDQFDKIIKDIRVKLINESKIIGNFINDGDPVLLSFNTKEQKQAIEFTWENNPDTAYVIELEINPLSQTDVEIQKSFVPYQKWTSCAVHERFWDKLKLAFSKKKVYTDD